MVTSHQETPREELVNSLTHLLGLLLSGAGLWLSLNAFASKPLAAWSLSLFSSALSLLYFFSACYHACPWRGLKSWLQRLDHGAIFIFIAASHTPFCLFCLPSPLREIALALIWTVALSGACFSLCGGARYPNLSMLWMMSLGWLALLFLPYLLKALSWAALSWLLGGGLSYTVGSVFFATHWFRFSHALWHLFVMLGSLCHYTCLWLMAQASVP